MWEDIMDDLRESSRIARSEGDEQGAQLQEAGHVVVH